MPLNFIKKYSAGNKSVSQEDVQPEVSQQPATDATEDLENELNNIFGEDSDAEVSEENLEDAQENIDYDSELNNIFGDDAEPAQEDDNQEMSVAEMLAQEDATDGDPSEALKTQPGFNKPYEVQIDGVDGQQEKFLEDPDRSNQNGPEDVDDAAKEEILAEEGLDVADTFTDALETYSHIFASTEENGWSPAVFAYMNSSHMLDGSSLAQDNNEVYNEYATEDTQQGLDLLVTDHAIGFAKEGFAELLGTPAEEGRNGAALDAIKAAGKGAKEWVGRGLTGLVEKAKSGSDAVVNLLRNDKGEISKTKSAAAAAGILGVVAAGAVGLKKLIGTLRKPSGNSIKASLTELFRGLGNAATFRKRDAGIHWWRDAKINWKAIRAKSIGQKASVLASKVAASLGDSARQIKAMGGRVNSFTEKALHVSGKGAVLRTSAKLGAAAIVAATLSAIGWVLYHVIIVGLDKVKSIIKNHK